MPPIQTPTSGTDADPAVLPPLLTLSSHHSTSTSTSSTTTTMAEPPAHTATPPPLIRSSSSASTNGPASSSSSGTKLTDKIRRRIRLTKQPSVDLRSFPEGSDWGTATAAGSAPTSSALQHPHHSSSSSSSSHLQQQQHNVQSSASSVAPSAARSMRSFMSTATATNTTGAPRFSGHLQYLPTCDIRERPDKMEFRIRIQGKRAYYELRSADLTDFQAWQLVFQRARDWKDPNSANTGNLDGYVLIQNDARGITRTASFDSLSAEMFEDDAEGTQGTGSDGTAATELHGMTADELEASRKHHRAIVMGEMKTLQERYANLEALGHEGRTPEAELFMKSSKSVLKAFSVFMNHLELEIEHWEGKYHREAKRSEDLVASLRVVAREHHQLERAATKNPSDADNLALAAYARVPKPNFKSIQPPTDEEDDSEDSDSEYFDAVERAANIEHDLASIKDLNSPDTTPTNKSVDIDSVSVRSKAGQVFVRRDRLPANRSPKKLSLWSLLKNNIGKDLSKIALPIVINEPLSGLQRCCEDMEYTVLLDKAADAESSTLRLAYLACFAISNYSTTMTRVNKPFNPILGETYELIRPERGDGFRLFGEQVSHHPPISVMQSESLAGKWDWWQTVLLGSSFRGKDMEIYPLGITHVILKSGGKQEHYTFRKVTCCVRNIIVGRSWVDNYGQLSINNHTTGDVAELTFHPYSFFSGAVADADAVVKDAKGHIHYRLKGKWTENVRLSKGDTDPSNGEIIWQRTPLPPSANLQFDFTHFTLSMNEIEKDHVKSMPKTDCRFRPDQTLYEQGKIDDAQREKDRLEEKQRAARRIREARGETYKPKFFELKFDPELGRDNWYSNNTYWKRRDQRQWDDMPDLYSTDPDPTLSPNASATSVSAAGH